MFPISSSNQSILSTPSQRLCSITSQSESTWKRLWNSRKLRVKLTMKATHFHKEKILLVKTSIKIVSHLWPTASLNLRLLRRVQILKETKILFRFLKAYCIRGIRRFWEDKMLLHVPQFGPIFLRLCRSSNSIKVIWKIKKIQIIKRTKMY